MTNHVTDEALIRRPKGLFMRNTWIGSLIRGAWPMRLSSLLTTFALLLLACTFVGAGLTVWGIQATRHNDARIALSNASYAEHLALQSNVNRLFKEKADRLLVGNGDDLTPRINADIDGNIEVLRDLIAREIELDREEEFEELAFLAQIERKIEEIRASYREFLADPPEDDPARVARLANLLNRSIDQGLSDLIAEALAGEREEVEENMQAAAALRSNLNAAAWAIMTLMAVLTGLVSVGFRRWTARPLAGLLAGANAYRQGDYSRTLEVEGAAELRDLAATLTAMAAEIGARERALTTQARALEKKVLDRTAELRETLGRLQRTEESRRQLMADVSHELRTPITIIQGEADIALRGGAQSPDEQSDTLSRIRDAARHSSKIVDDLLLVARVEAGQLRIDRRSVDLNLAVADAASMVSAEIEVMQQATPAVCEVDALRLRQCLLAAMNNALRYGGKQVLARVEPTDQGFAIMIEDDGPGMSEKERSMAFERFSRGSGADGAGVDGNGLGLPIVRSIMQAHGGSAALLPREGGGLIVRLDFPVGLETSANHGEQGGARMVGKAVG
ncbi:sensor histidine kinase [Paracoccus salsus]|uniref:sensor histidine kinase n=1 Tax=Paracoccus salsus TaxID=2911061 RepID=UPI001F3379A3|nr:HAMP domain-containing sensor histidine kinase [Paracoccus salsus]MCF3975083.1 HAMP domain-containing histidine kinase [Paracoccus salsus]